MGQGIVARPLAGASVGESVGEARAKTLPGRPGLSNDRRLAIVAHDLRGPLGAIAASAELLRRDPGASPATLRGAERIARCAGRMAHLVEALLDHARARSTHGMPIAAAPVDLARIAHDVVDELRAAHPDRAIDVHAEGDLRGVWDGGRLAQVVSNLVGNAVAHGRPGGRVTVSLRPLGHRVVLEVHNEGAIPEGRRARLFTPFGADDGRPRRGLGLGLYVARAIVHAHRGTIAVRSSADDGTRVMVRLPRDAAMRR